MEAVQIQQTFDPFGLVWIRNHLALKKLTLSWSQRDVLTQLTTANVLWLVVMVDQFVQGRNEAELEGWGKKSGDCCVTTEQEPFTLIRCFQKRLKKTK